MKRLLSKTYLNGATAPSNSNQDDYTHVIIQNTCESKDLPKHINIPMGNLCSFGQQLKINSLVTYKKNIKDRRTVRGKIVFFGNENDCTEQVEVLSAVAEEKEAESSRIVETFDTCDISTFDDPSPRRIGAKEKSKTNVKKQQASVSTMKSMLKETEKDPRRSQSIKNRNLSNPNSNKNETIGKLKMTKPLNDKSPNNQRKNPKLHDDTRLSLQKSDQRPSETQKSTTDRTYGNQKTLDQMLKKTVVVGKTSGSESSISFETLRKLPSSSSKAISSSNEINGSKTTNSSKAISNTGNIHAQKASTSSSKSFSNTTNQKQQMNNKSPEPFDEDSTDNNDGKIDQLSLDLDVGDREYFVKKYNTLFHQNKILQLKYDNLVLKYEKLKENTIPMPNDAVRNWMINSVKLFGPKLQTSTKSIAEALNVDESLLNGCRRKTGTHTAREFVKLIYTPEQLRSKRGPEMTPMKKQLVRAYAERLHGPFPDDRPFNEAINGVFRNTVHSEKKQTETMKVVKNDRVGDENDHYQSMYADENGNDLVDLICHEEEEEEEQELDGRVEHEEEVEEDEEDDV